MKATSSAAIQIKNLRNRRGRICISRDKIEKVREGGLEELAQWAAIFQHFVVVDTTYIYGDLSVQYIGYHEQFDEIPQGHIEPPYVAVTNRRVDECGVTHFEVTMHREHHG